MIDDNKKVKIVVTKLKGHASLWWDHLQIERQKRGKEKIKAWAKMIGKMKKKSPPTDYQGNLFRKIQNLRHKDMSVKEYSREFYKLDIRFGCVDDEVEKVAR